jgi:hypothetical protein
MPGGRAVGRYGKAGRRYAGKAVNSPRRHASGQGTTLTRKDSAARLGEFNASLWTNRFTAFPPYRLSALAPLHHA